MWDEQVEEFTGRFRLIPWDLPGHGRSRFPREPAGLKSLTGDMAAILDNAHVDRAVLMGLGVGGALSLRFWRCHPDRVRALILIGTSPGLRSPSIRAMANAQVETMAAALESDGLDSLEGGAEVDPKQHIAAHDLAAAARALLIQTTDGALPWLAEIDVPVLILAGGEDRPHLTAADILARTIPNARKAIVPRANHAATLHKPEAANAIIEDFLNRLP